MQEQFKPVFAQKTIDVLGEKRPVDESTMYFSVTDLACAAALVANGFELSSLDRANAKKVKFIFKGKPGFLNAKERYWASSLPVDCQTYANIMRRLKNQIYSE